MKKTYRVLSGFFALFMVFSMWVPSRAEEPRSTAFDILPGWLHYPGVNVQAEVGFEGLQYGDFYKGFSTEFLTLKNVVGVRYGFIQGLTLPWSAHEFGFNIPIKKLEETGIKINLPSFLQGAGVSFGLGISNRNQLTGQVGIVLIGGGF